MSIFNPWVLLALVAITATSFFSGYKVRGDAEKAKQLAAALAYAELVRNEQDRSAKIAADTERDVAAIRLRARTREAQLRGELNHAPNRTCMLPESSRMLFNAAVRDANGAASGQSGESVPAAGTAAKPGNNGRPASGGNQ